MGEPTCVLSAFSYTSSGIHTNEHSEGNNPPLYGIEGESVSLGRYMSESLSWEKWSSFSRNRYVEEAEQYSKPGSVAQKKAYFEAHFKRMAALKAAALLEQANNQAPVSDKLDNNKNNSSNKTMMIEGDVNHHSSNRDAQDTNTSLQVGRNGQETGGFAGYDENTDPAKFVGNKKDDDEVGNSIVGGNEKTQVEESAAAAVIEVEPSTQNSTKMEHHNIVTQPKLQQDRNNKQGNPSPVVKKNPPLSSYMPSVDRSRTPSLFSSSLAKPIAPGKENYATPTNNKSCVQDTGSKKKTPLRRSINRELNKLFSPVIRKIGKGGQKDKDCSTPLNTPAEPYVDDSIQSSPPETRQPAKRGVRALFEASRSENKTFSPSGMKSPGPSRSRINSPIIPDFCLRNREKTTRSKENLEEKFIATQKSQPQSKFKAWHERKQPFLQKKLMTRASWLSFRGKAEAEFSKLRQSFCFKVTQLSELHGQTETLSRIPVPKQKSKVLRHPSSNKEKKPTTGTTSQSHDTLPPLRPALKSSLKHSRRQ